MKHRSKHAIQSVIQSAGPQPVNIRFEFSHAHASSVAVAGTFNDWNPSSRSLRCSGDGEWRSEIALPPGVYEYRLVVDGQWIPDPQAHESVPNPFGGQNSILRVTPPGADPSPIVNTSK